MNLKNILFVTGILLFISCAAALADRQLGEAEVLEIFQKLTSQPRRTWISAGTIEATHEEYRAPKTTETPEINRQISQEIREYQNSTNSRELTEELQKMKLDAIPFNVRYRLSNESKMNSTVFVRYDVEKFYWEINVTSRTDSVKPGKDLEGNFMTEEFNLDGNARRAFAWDGEKFTTYALSANYAIVDSTGSTPHVVNGPLTAGIIPWGYGYYTYERLSAAKFSAEEKNIARQTQIHLTLNTSDGSEMLCVLDPERDYAVLSCSINKPDNSVIYQQYDNYQQISGSWVPATISIERYDARSNRLLAYDLWNLTRISDTVPAPYIFNVDYAPDALIEYRSYVTNKPLIYRYSHIADTELQLAERLSFAASEGTQPQNCATAALKYTVSQLGKAVTDRQLEQLVGGTNKTTSLYAMKQFAQSLGLYCRVVRTDLQTLENLSGCKAILHIPGKNHFVVLDRIDDQYVWLVDLTSNKFYYRTNINFFGMDWTEGTALLISNKPIQVNGNFVEINYAQLCNIIGSSGYDCTKLYQEYNIVLCDYVGGLCGGYYQWYFERWGCYYAPSGSCTNSRMLRMIESPCINSPYDPWACTVTGEWTCYFMRACK
jgi:hypothetical protein